MVCAEIAPWAKTGGLGDAVAGLSDALCASGHDVRVLLPRYSHLAVPRGRRHTVDGLGGPFRLGEIEPEPTPPRKPSVASARSTLGSVRSKLGSGGLARASSSSSSASSPRTPFTPATRAMRAGSCTSPPPPLP